MVDINIVSIMDMVNIQIVAIVDNVAIIQRPPLHKQKHEFVHEIAI
jgi:hypothetical protein